MVMERTWSSVTVEESEAGLLAKDDVAIEIDDRDKETPDKWVPRHPDLIRLTGKHPFNCEPPLTALVQNGFITPPSLHYVRNHGYVPDCKWETHRVEVKGLVEKPLALTMDEIVAMPSFTIPVTLVCAGNRRKEENMVKQTIGFNWGAAGHATNMWTGVRLRDILISAGIDLGKARHVCFVGEEDLPNGKYGTSVDIATAMDPIGDVMIAYRQNDILLAPDHGYPVRVIIPGWIGGRMVKWLRKIEVTAEPSDNYYHFFDNRIMPPHVDAELAKAEGWWYKPEYLFNQLNINSAISKPEHGELIPMGKEKTYKCKGYAYTGGGRKITRVELTLDGGNLWKLCNVSYPEEVFSSAPKNGRYWCWVFWEIEVSVLALVRALSNTGEIACRAWDEANNTQPDKITWNLMGMGNNCHFRIKMGVKELDGGVFLECAHPTIAGPSPGGWMKAPEKKVVVAEKKKEEPSSGKTFTLKEIAKHNTAESAWIIVHDKVYDCTSYLKDHPGGEASIVMNAGTDTTEEFEAIHSQKAQNLLADYYIGNVAAGERATSDDLASSPVVSESDEDSLVALNPKRWTEFKLVEREDLSSDSRRFRFALQSSEHKLGLPVGHHFLVSARIDGKLVIRAYTPTSSDADLGFFELVIKVYFKNVHPKFPNGGLMSQHFESLSVGDSVSVRGPLGHYEYLRDGKIDVHHKKMSKKELGFICGGTGITPAFQIMKAIARNPSDTTQVFLLYANRTPSDILLRAELDEMAATRDNIHVWYTVDIPTDDWKFSTGFIDEKMIRNHLPAPSPDSFVGLCGPPPMIEFACLPNLKKIGFQEEVDIACF